jgi:ATP-dependent Clp protease ATP-binding subunit ClpX
MDTRNILFICGGAFDGIERKIAQRMNTHTVGYNNVSVRHNIDSKNLLKYIQPQDLKSFGLIPELIGRLPALTYLRPLDREALRNILTEPKNSLIRQQKKLFEMDGVNLEFAPEALEVMVDKAMERNLGARGLRGIVESVMTDLQFSVPGTGQKELLITADYVREQLAKSEVL